MDCFDMHQFVELFVQLLLVVVVVVVDAMILLLLSSSLLRDLHIVDP
jgi:hypothetical protein